MEAAADRTEQGESLERTESRHYAGVHVSNTQRESDDAWTLQTMAMGHGDCINDVRVIAMSPRPNRPARHDFSQIAR